MPKSVPRDLAARLAALGCVVKFNTEVSNQRHEKGDMKGEIKEDRKGFPMQNTPIVRALIIPAGSDGKAPANAKPWCNATGSDRNEALKNALDVAEKTERPMFSMAQLQAENAQLRAQIAEADRKAEALRQEVESGGSIAPHPGGSQDSRGRAATAARA